MSKRIALGKIAGPHGVKGLVKVVCYGDEPALLEDLSPLYIAEDRDVQINLKIKNPIGRYYIAEIDGFFTRTHAEDFQGYELFVERDQLPEINEDNTYYYEDLVGRDVIGTDGNKIGIVKAVDNFGATDLLEIKPKSGHPFYVPFLDKYVPDVGESITIQNYEEFMN